MRREKVFETVLMLLELALCYAAMAAMAYWRRR